jgi:ACS family tartrate transporter-like MFS transporter
MASPCKELQPDGAERLEGERIVTDTAIRKIRNHVLPLVFLIYLVAFIDRANVAYAKITMSSDLAFSERVYGFGAGVFFVGYVILEIPGAMIVRRWGARRWVSRILISWGFCTALTAFIHTALEFYLARFLLGLAEAGLIPGILVYLHDWFPEKYRARALARFFIASPISLAIGGPVAGVVLRLNWLHIAAWRWLFFLEGIPAVVIGIVCLFVMVDGPQKAKWLSAREAQCLLAALEQERRTTIEGPAGTRPAGTIWRAFCRADVLLLAAVSFFANIGISGFFLWLPSTIHAVSAVSPAAAAALSGVPFAAAVIAVLSMSHSSDRCGERRLHTAIPLLLAAFIFPLTTRHGLALGPLLLTFCASAAAIYGFGPSYWAIPSQRLAGYQAAAAFGFLNIWGAIGSFVGPSALGILLTNHYSLSTGVMFLSGCFLLAGACVLGIPHPDSERRSKTPSIT